MFPIPLKITRVQQCSQGKNYNRTIVNTQSLIHKIKNNSLARPYEATQHTVIQKHFNITSISIYR